MTINSLRLHTALLCFVAVALCQETCAQAPTRESLEQHVRSWFAAWDSGDPMRIAIWETPAPGFGYRIRSPRKALAAPAHLEQLKAFFASVAYFRITPDEVHTELDGDIGLVWAFSQRNFRSMAERPRSGVSGLP